MTRSTRTTGFVLAAAVLAGVACVTVSTGWSAPKGGGEPPATAEQLSTAKQQAPADTNPPRADLGHLPSPYGLLQGEQMRKEVGLTEQQSEQLKQIAFTAPPDVIARIENVLTPKQTERLKKLELLQRRADILENPQFLDQIVALTDEQKQTTLKFHGETLAKIEQLRRDGHEEILDVLTPEQTKKLRDWNPRPAFR